MSQFYKVKGNPSLVRDISSNAIINMNNSDYVNYLKSQNIELQKQNKAKQQEDDINNLKEDISEIKYLLMKLIKDNKEI